MGSSVLLVGSEPAAESGAAWLAKGFRPFFLGAGVHAVLAVPAWIAVWLGAPWPHAGLMALDWHAHEMVFGFAGAVIAGFLLTAVTNWTGRTTLEGGGLLALFALWLGGRIVPCIPNLSGIVAAAFDAAFWTGLAVACARPISASRSRRNYGFLVLLLGLLLASMLSHASRLGVWNTRFGLGQRLGIDLLVLAILIVTSRVVPMFTRNATGVTDISSQPALDRLAVLAMVLLTALDVANSTLPPRAALSTFAGVIVLARSRRWGLQHSLGQPLLWILHLGNVWVGVGLILGGLSAFVPALPASLALHAITAGGIGLLCLGMMTRVTLGHTGRMLAIPRTMVWAMWALSLAVLLRVLGPLISPARAPILLGLSALLWSLAFASYLFVYGKALLTPRVDGRPG